MARLAWQAQDFGVITTSSEVRRWLALDLFVDCINAFIRSYYASLGSNVGVPYLRWHSEKSSAVVMGMEELGVLVALYSSNHSVGENV